MPCWGLIGAGVCGVAMTIPLPPRCPHPHTPPPPPPHTLGPCPCPLAGRIHMVQLRAGAHFFPCSITVLDQDGMEFLFGLDNLKRHQVRAGQAGGAGRGGGGQWTVGWWRG